MVVIRLARGGAKKRPFYHVVVADKKKEVTDSDFPLILQKKNISYG